MTENLNKRIVVLGNISPNGKRQWGIVVSGGYRSSGGIKSA